MNLQQARCLSCLASVLFGAALVRADEAFFLGLGDLPGQDYWSEALGVSADGTTVVGRSSSSRSEQFSQEAFRWTRETGMIGLGGLRSPRVVSAGLGVSADGSIVVGGTTSDRGFEAFRWTGEEGMLGLGDFRRRNLSSEARALSRDGLVVVGRGRQESGRHEGFRWTEEEGMVALGVLPGGSGGSARAVSADGSVIVGSGSSERFATEAFRWQDAKMVGLGALLDSDFSVAFGVSADGSVVVGMSARGAPNRVPTGGAFRWTAETGMVNLGDIPGERPGSCALAVSADGSVVVGRAGKWGTSKGIQAFIWDAEHGMRSLQRILTEEFRLDLSQWRLDLATAISRDARTIVGWGFHTGFGMEAWIAHLGPPPCDPCDTNCDGSVDLTDVEPFIGLLLGGEPCDACSGDTNEDGSVDLADVEAFIQCLL